MKRPYLLCLAATVGVATTNTFLRVLGGSDAVTAAAAAAGAASSEAGSKSLFVWWEMLTHGDARTLLDPRWWYHYILAEFEAEPAHAAVETICILTILYLLVWRKPAPLPQEKLSKKEEEELIAEWKPAPLCPEWVPSEKQRFIVESGTGRTIVANGGKTYLNFASTNFLGLADRPETKVACRDTIEKYGVGSCGPRGFYGTFDVHLAIEAAIAKFMRAEECILYSDSLASISSVIPAFAKKGDTIVVDDSVAFGIQQGCLLSRSTIHYYQHGDMASLERVLETIAAKEATSGGGAASKRALAHRKFIVVEGVSSVYGDIVPLKRVCELKAKYGYRLIVDDSFGFGVLGKSGRGTLEHHGLTMQQPQGAPGVDILCASMDHTMASVGGFCVGNHQVVDHQRLSGAGYCFSASSPPYTSTAALETLAVIEDQGAALTATLRKKAAKVRRALASVHKHLAVLGEGDSDESPSIHLALKNADASRLTLERTQFEKMSDYLRDEAGIVTSVPEFIPADKNRAKPTLRILISTLHTDADLDKLVKAVGQAANKALR